jgi:lysine-specific demethylase 8
MDEIAFVACVFTDRSMIGVDDDYLKVIARLRQEHLQRVYQDEDACREARGAFMRVKLMQVRNTFYDEEYEEAMKHLDVAMIVSGPKLESGESLHGLVEEIEAKLGQVTELSLASLSIVEIPLVRDGRIPVEGQVIPGMHPCLVADELYEWPALRKWIDISYLLEVAGHRQVPVEIGSSYSDDPDWHQEIMSLRQFFGRFVTNESESVGYVAQFDLLAHVKRLDEDVGIPSSLEGSKFYRNCWLGPTGTFTPLHRDPQDNLFCQVVGYKEIILVAPEEGADGMALPEDACRLVLGPADALLIPKGWWHQVRSLSFSISISHWIVDYVL